MASLHQEATAVKLAVCDLSTSPYIDAAAAQMLAKLEDKLEQENIKFRVVEAHAEVRDILRVTGTSEILGGVSRYVSLADLVEDFERDTGNEGS
jgi:anti-anti-sigma factor